MFQDLQLFFLKINSIDNNFQRKIFCGYINSLF